MTARPRGAPEGTRGIGCFLVPRSGGGFRIRRLKDKLGTRALATGEIEFDGAPAYALGPLEDGFRTAVGVLNTSRWLNALGSAGLMRRATIVASEFAREREAFGRVISDYPLVRENLAVMKAEADAALASTHGADRARRSRIDKGEAGEEDTAWHRVLVNANKFVTSLAATKVTRRGIEALGGNGTIEDFSPLPRLYRDAIVFESWEGTHNVLCAQVLRDLTRLDAVDLVVERSGASAELAARLRRSVDDQAFGALHARRQLDQLVRSLQFKVLPASEPGRRRAPPAAASDSRLGSRDGRRLPRSDRPDRRNGRLASLRGVSSQCHVGARCMRDQALLVVDHTALGQPHGLAA